MKSIYAVVLALSFAHSAFSASERCWIVTKSFVSGSSVPTRSNAVYRNVSFQACYQLAADTMKTSEVGATLMVKHTSRSGVEKVFKLGRHTAEEFERYYLY